MPTVQAVAKLAASAATAAVTAAQTAAAEAHKWKREKRGGNAQVKRQEQDDPKRAADPCRKGTPKTCYPLHCGPASGRGTSKQNRSVTHNEGRRQPRSISKVAVVDENSTQPAAAGVVDESQSQQRKADSVADPDIQHWMEVSSRSTQQCGGALRTCKVAGCVRPACPGNNG